MSVSVIHFAHEGRAQWGVVRAGRITPIPGSYPTTGELVRAHDAASLAALAPGTLDEAEVELLSPVTRNQQFVCLGANYRQHMIESGLDPDAKTYNMVFTKASSCIVPANHDVVRPRRVRLLDYEVELGLVLRRELTAPRRVSDADLAELVAGVVIVNDYSARDVQIPEGQFYKGKSFRTFGPVGPYLCLLEPRELGLLRELTLRLSVNGELRQEDSTRNMVHGPAETLSELSGVHDLFAGDLLATGTPAGCALSVPSPAKQKLAALLPEARKWQAFFAIQAKRSLYLKPGDLVEARITSPRGELELGVQRNRVVEERPW